MRFFFLIRRKHVNNVVSDFYTFIFSVCSFFGAYNIVNTLARVPLKVQAVINGLMSAFFVKSRAFFFGKQDQAKVLDFSQDIFSSLTLKKLAMTTSLLSQRKNIANVIIPALGFAKRITFALLLTIATVSFVQAQATLTSDQADYPPGSTATLMGSDFLPGDTVIVQVFHYGVDGKNDTSAAHQPWTVIADEDGDFTTTWLVPADEGELGATLLAKAEGKTSLFYAETTFTDVADANDGEIAMVESPADVSRENEVKSKN